MKFRKYQIATLALTLLVSVAPTTAQACTITEPSTVQTVNAAADTQFTNTVQIEGAADQSTSTYSRKSYRDNKRSRRYSRSHAYNNGFKEYKERGDRGYYVPVVTEPVVTEPVVTEPAATAPEVTESVATEPVITQPAVTEPAVTETEVTEPEVTAPEVTAPEVTAPEVVEPEVVEPIVEEPVVSVPEVLEPAVTVPVVTAPVVVDPIVIGPIVVEPIIPIVLPVSDLPADAVYLSTFADVSGSIAEFSGSISSGSKTLTLTSSNHDFKVGHGISIQGAGNTNNWLITKVTAVNGSTLTLASSATKSVSSAKTQHDDTQAVNAAISTGYDAYYFDFDYLNIKGLDLKSNTIYDGMDRCTMNLPLSYSSVSIVSEMIIIDNEDNVTFRNFTVNGGKSRGVVANREVGVMMMKITNSEGIEIQGSLFEDSSYTAVQMRSTVRDVLIEDNRMMNVDVGIFGMPEWMGNLYLENAVFQNNYFEGGSSEAISICSGMWNNVGHADNIKILNNVIKDKEANGIQYGSKTTNITISGNEVTGCNHGICSIDPNLESVALMTSSGATITNNTVYNNTWHNFIIDGKDVYLANNKISQGDDVLVLGLSALDGITVENNTFTDTSIKWNPAIRIHNLKNAVIKSNVFVKGATTNYNAALGIQSGSVSNLQIDSNNFDGMKLIDNGATTTVEALNLKY